MVLVHMHLHNFNSVKCIFRTTYDLTLHFLHPDWVIDKNTCSGVRQLELIGSLLLNVSLGFFFFCFSYLKLNNRHNYLIRGLFKLNESHSVEY